MSLAKRRLGDGQEALIEFEVGQLPMPAKQSRVRALNLRSLNSWAAAQLPWLSLKCNADPKSDLFLFIQASKLSEEVGELNAQLLGYRKAQRRRSNQVMNAEALSGEFADVLLCVAILAETLGVDLSAATRAKVDIVASRQAADLA